MGGTCQGITKAGKRCPSTALTGQAFCLMPAPDAAELRRAAGRRGGHARSTKARARAAMPDALGADELAAHLSRLLLDVVSGKVEAKVGSAAAAVAKVLLDVKQAHTIEDLEQEVARLRTMVGGGQRRTA